MFANETLARLLGVRNEDDLKTMVGDVTSEIPNIIDKLHKLEKNLLALHKENSCENMIAVAEGAQDIGSDAEVLVHSVFLIHAAHAAVSPQHEEHRTEARNQGKPRFH